MTERKVASAHLESRRAGEEKAETKEGKDNGNEEEKGGGRAF